MPEEEKKEDIRKEELIDVGDADEKATEIDLDKKAEGGEVKDEKTTQDSDKPADTPAEPDKPVDVRDSSDSKESDKKEEVKPQNRRKRWKSIAKAFKNVLLNLPEKCVKQRDKKKKLLLMLNV